MRTFPRFLIKVAAVSLLVGALADANEHIPLSESVCDNVSKLYLEHEGDLKCQDILPLGPQEMESYRAMCFGCDPNLQYFGDHYNATGRAFSERAGAPVKGAPLNRVPATKSLLNVTLPGIDAKKCREAGSKYATDNAKSCADLKALSDAFYAPGETDAISEIAGAEKSLRDANDAANAAVIEVIEAIQKKKKKKGANYSATCTSENARVEKLREGYNKLLGRAKDQVWTNVLKEVGLKRGCLKHYIDEYPEFWCTKSAPQGQKPIVDKTGCLQKLAEKPADTLARFKLYSADPATMLNRVEMKARRLLEEKKYGKPIIKDVGGEDPLQDSGTKPADNSSGGN